MAHRDAQVKAGQCCRTLSTSSLLYAPNSELCRSESTTIRLGLRSALQTPAVQGRFSVVYWYWKQPAAAGTFFEKHSRKLHSFFLFLLYDILVKKSIIEEGVCIMAKILIVDDEPRIRELIREHLQYSGYICEEAADGTAALTQLSGGAFDLVILDLMMPGLSGSEACMKIREFSDVPIIMLTARSEDADKIMGFACGADDYVTKPFNILELKARVRALLRRAAGVQRSQGSLLTVGKLTLNTEERVAIRDGEPVELTAKEYDLIELLMRNPRRVYSRENLMNVVWGYTYAGDYRTVDVHIRRLREKLEENPAEPDHILTKWGVGYYFKG